MTGRPERDHQPAADCSVGTGSARHMEHNKQTGIPCRRQQCAGRNNPGRYSRFIKPLGLLLLVWMLLMGGFRPEAAAQRINLYQSDDFDLIYFGKRYSFLVPHVAGTYRNAITFHNRLWNYQGGKTTIVLNDFSDFGHGGAIVMPLNQVFLGIEPYSFAFSIIPSNERFQWLFNHELTHVVMADKANREDLFWRKMMLGKVRRNETYPLSALWSYLTVPRWYSPRWYHEGIACFMETWMSGGLGRAMGYYDEMYFRSIVNERQPIYSLVGLETEGTVVDFQVGANAYLYGTRFVSYLAHRYGIDSLKTFYDRRDDSRPFFASQFRRTYGKSVNQAWKEWIGWEVDFQEKNLEAVSRYPLTPFRAVTPGALGSISNYGYNPATGKIYAAVNHPGDISRIAEIDRSTGKVRKICELDSPLLYYSTHLAYDPSGNRVFITEQNNNMRSLVEVDVETGRKKRLIPYPRVGDLAFNPADRSLWGIRHDNGYAILVRIPEPYTQVVPVYTAEFGKVLFDLDISRSGRYLSASLSGIRGEQSLVLFDLEALDKGKKGYQLLHHLEDNTLTQFKFSDDERFLYGTSYYTGVSNIWRFDRETGDFSLLSNNSTGFFMPLQVDPDSLLVLQFRRDGMLPGTIPIRVTGDANPVEYLGNLIHRKYPVVEEWSLPPAIHPAQDGATPAEGEYPLPGLMKLANGYPDISGFKNSMAVGYRLNFRDPGGFSDLSLFLGGSPWSPYPGKQKIHAQLTWKYLNWKFSGSYNKTDFYDLFGPTRRSRAGYSAGAGYGRSSTRRSPFKTRYELEFATYGDLEVLPQYQNVSTPIRNLQAAAASWSVEKLRKTLGAIEDEKGYAVKAMTETILAKGQLYPSLVSAQAAGFLIPGIRNTSFWIRNMAGVSLGDSSSPLSRFYFGGFRNNYVDWQPSEQYRENLAFPGVDIDEVPARHFVKTMGELNLKPIRMRNVGASWLYPTYVKTSLFASHLLTDFHQPSLKRNLFNFGAQMDIQLVLASYLRTTWSAGYAVKTEKGTVNRQQWMFSLKLLGD